MRRALVRVAFFLSVLAPALPADADFHLWAIDEIFTTADGKVQFIEFVALAGGQQFLAGHGLTASGGPDSPRSHTFASSLPFDTSGRRFLVGTASFEALGIVPPDYTVADGFLFPGGGTINFGEGSDVWTYPAMPTDGRLSLNRNGSTGVNSPRNFFNATGSVESGAADHNVQGLWWRSPAGSESGWGLNISHQGTILFGTWFTYGSDGAGLWLVMPDARRSGPNTYSGPIYRTTGPAFDSVPFSPSQVVATPVGTATLAFSNANSGTFSYTVDTVTQSKPITRQVYASPQSVCTQSGGSSGPRSYQDLWWRAPAGSESGWGVNLVHQGNILFATWFTYGADGKGIWFVMSDLRKGEGEIFSGKVFRTTGPAFSAVPFDPQAVAVTEVGTASFAFASPDGGTFSYNVNGVSQSKPIERQIYSTPESTCVLSSFDPDGYPQ